VISGAGHFLDLESLEVRRAAGTIERRFLLGIEPIMVESMRAEQSSQSSDEALFRAS
jgi:hypothetical protein